MKAVINTKSYRWLDEDGYICIQEDTTQEHTSADKFVRQNATMTVLKEEGIAKKG